MKLPTVFSQTSKGQAQQWEIEIEGSRYRTHEGMVGGKITTTEWTEVFAKNIGRANETTPEQQALAQAQSKHKKKIEAGGHLFLEDIAKEKFFEPMTAQKWKDYGDEVTYPTSCQPKLDGMRCTVNLTSMTSRGGKNVPAAPHVLVQLREVFELFPDVTFDGELYNHKLKANFNKIISLAKKQKPTAQDLKDSEEMLEYHIYDVHFSGTPDLSFEDRQEVLVKIFSFLREKGNSPMIKYVETWTAKTVEALDELHDRWIGDGYEGQMVRNPKSAYQKKRTKDLLKRKISVDEEFMLMDVLPGVGNAAGRAASAVLALKDGRTFDTGIIGDHAYATNLLVNKAKYIGQQATVVYQNLTPLSEGSEGGKPRCGKLKIIRDYE